MKKSRVVLIGIIILMILSIILSICLMVINKQDKQMLLEDRNEGGTKYDSTQLKNVQTKLNGLSKELTKYINDIDEFNINLKEYIYLNGLVDATTANIESWNVEKNKLNIEIQLNDVNNTKLKVVIDLEKNTSKIIEDN